MALAICAREQMHCGTGYCRIRERLFSEIDDCWALYLLMLTSLRQCMDLVELLNILTTAYLVLMQFVLCRVSRAYLGLSVRKHE